MVEILPCSGCFITCMGAHFPTVEWDKAIRFSTLSRMSRFLWHSSKWPCWFCFFFFYQGFISQTLTTHRAAGEGRGPSYSTLPLPPLTNIQTFICNFAREMTIPAGLVVSFNIRQGLKC